MDKLQLIGLGSNVQIIGLIIAFLIFTFGFYLLWIQHGREKQERKHAATPYFAISLLLAMPVFSDV